MAERTQDKGRTNITLRLGIAEVRALKLEAARRVQPGEARRFDQSSIVRDALRWFLNAAPSHQEDADAEDGGGHRDR